MLVERTIQKLIAAADDAGRIHFNTEQQPWVERESGQALKSYLINHILSFMDDFPMFLSGFEAKKRGPRVLDIQATQVKAAPHYDVSFNLATMLLLPGLNPGEELRELSALFDSLKPFYQRWHQNRPWVVVTNNRDNNRRTYGLMECRYKAPDAEKSTTAEQETEQLRDRLAASPVLSSWLKAMALDLNRLGPWSWGTFASQHVFDAEEDPVQRYLRAEAETRFRDESA